MNVYNPARIGKLITGRFSGDHSVYEYDSDKVIKFSKIDFFLGFQNALKKTIADQERCTQFFGEYLVPTENVLSPEGRRVALIQPLIRGRSFAKEDMREADIRRQFLDIMERYQAMIASGSPRIDLVGHEGLFKGRFGNMFITPERRLLIFDTTSVDFARSLLGKIFMYPLVKLFLWIQNNIVEKYQKEVRMWK